jgi:CheY-like chemotaxis protein
MSSTRPKTILVIDDQDDERAIQQAMLEHLGYEVRATGDGPTGLHAALEAPPDLILLDIAMPQMDGFTVCRALRVDPRTAAVPVLFFTASVVGDLQQQAEDAGGSGVLAKPVDPHEVAAEIRRLIGPPLP